MGQFLALSLATRIRVYPSDMQEVNTSEAELIDRLRQFRGFDPDHYLRADDGKALTWTLHPELVSAELLPFLTELYPLVYGGDESASDWRLVLDDLGKMPPADWPAYLQNPDRYAFQEDHYGPSDYLKFPFGKTLAISYDDVLLALEGKIFMEQHGRLFRFFEHCIATAFSRFRLARSLRVYITG